jgi:hypothetical protein
LLTAPLFESPCWLLVEQLFWSKKFPPTFDWRNYI